MNTIMYDVWDDGAALETELTPIQSASGGPTVPTVAVFPRTSAMQPAPALPIAGRPYTDMSYTPDDVYDPRNCVTIGGNGVHWGPCDPTGIWNDGYRNTGFSGNVWMIGLLLLLALILFRK